MKYRSMVLEADKPNKNKRIYPRALLERVVAEAQEAVGNRSLIGEIGFPEDMIIHFASASHVVTDLVMEGSEMVAEVEVLDTPMGKVLKSMIENGAGVALRPMGVGAGKVDDDGNLVIGEDYRMISISVIPADEAA